MSNRMLLIAVAWTAATMASASAGAEPTATGAGVLVAILDAPEPTHLALAGQIEPGINIPALREGREVPGTGTPTTHGTAVAGAVLSVAPDARILPVDPDDPAVPGDGAIEDVADGIRWAVDHGADVVVVSLATPQYTEYMEDAVAYANDEGVLVIAGAGNTEERTSNCEEFFGRETDPGDRQYPASYDDVLSVGGLDATGGIWECSQRRDVDTWAPAVHLELPTVDGGTGRLSGTSYAAPQVGGLASIALQANPDLTPSELTAVLTGGAPLSEGQDPSDVEVAAQNILVRHTFDQLQAEAGDDGCGPGTFGPDQRTLSLTYAQGTTTIRIDAATIDVDADGDILLSMQIDDLTIFGPDQRIDETVHLAWDLWVGTSPEPSDYEVTWDAIPLDEASGEVRPQILLSRVEGPIIGLLGRSNSLGYNPGEARVSDTAEEDDCSLGRLDRPYNISSFSSMTDKHVDGFRLCSPGEYFLIPAPASMSPAATPSMLAWFDSGSFPTVEITQAAADAGDCGPANNQEELASTVDGTTSQHADNAGRAETSALVPVILGSLVLLSGIALAVRRRD